MTEYSNPFVDGAQPADLPRARPVIGYPGGKGRLLKHILPLIPPHTTYVEPFFGGGAVFFSKTKSHHEVINDINRDLVHFMRNAKHHREAILDELALVLNSRREFEDYLAQPGLTEIQRAARWFIRNKLSFGGMGKNFAITRTHAITSRAKYLIAIASLSRRLDSTTVEERSYENIFASYDSPETFWFLDPPYLDGAGAAYSGWSNEQVVEFCGRVKKLKGAWLVTFQDCPLIREQLAGYKLKAVTRANGIGNNHGKKGRVYREVLISSTAK